LRYESGDQGWIENAVADNADDDRVVRGLGFAARAG
jgi:hypothetical protein